MDMLKFPIRLYREIFQSIPHKDN